MNNVSNNQDLPLDLDISLASKTDQISVNLPVSNNFTGPDLQHPAHFSPIQESTNIPTNQTQALVYLSNSVRTQSHMPVINNFGFHNHASLPTSHSQFNSNHFILILDNVLKIKYGAIESSLAKWTLDDNNKNQSTKKLYESIIRSLNIGFSTELYFIPTFETLSPLISFVNYFFTRLIGSNYDKANIIFNHL